MSTPTWSLAFDPRWCFISTSLLTMFLVGKMQDMGVKCEVAISCRRANAFPDADVSSAEGFKNDPRNPYAAQIAKESHH